MTRRFTGDRLVLATHNKGKLAEFRTLMAPFGIAVSTAAEHGLPEPEETGDSFAANAALKALAAAQGSGQPALADDSGLAVRALGGAPGIYSARWAGPEKDFAGAMARVERAVAASGMGDAHAAFVCVLALAWPDGHVESFEGRVEGDLVFPPRGGKGFGYDPIFVAEGMDRSFAEIEAEEKHRVSHRARALARLVEACFSGR